MRYVYLILFFIFSFSLQATVYNPSDCQAATIANIVATPVVNGDTINVPAGNCSWGASAVVINAGVLIKGATVCTGSGDPNGGSSGVVSCTDNTNITFTGEAAFQTNGTTANPIRVTGFTFINGVTGSTQGLLVAANLVRKNVGFRIDHCHFKMAKSNSRNLVTYGWGDIDHNWFEDTVPSGQAAAPLDFYGSFSDHGYSDWNDATNLGTSEAVYVEANYYSVTGGATVNTEGFFDCYSGAKVVVRFNTVVGTELGGCHGTDSGFFRSAVSLELYGNSDTNASGSFGALNERGGGVLAFNNNFLGTAALNFIPLQTFRFGAQNQFSSNWGTAGPSIDWSVLSVVPTNQNSNVVTANAADFIAAHHYTALSIVGPLTNNASNGNFQLTSGDCASSGTYPATWNSAYNASTTDSAGCVWLNIGGQVTSSTVKYCAANPDTTCNADATCNALSGGDTCSRFLDTNGGNYPYRDQIGRVHNQVLAPAYEWTNTGNFTPPLFNVSGPNLTIIVVNRDFYNYNSSFTGASGVGSGTLASRPANCTAGVAYWSTDQGSWNTSGNGSGNGVLSKCTVTGTPGTWNSTYYTPYRYPHILDILVPTGNTGTPNSVLIM